MTFVATLPEMKKTWLEFSDFYYPDDNAPIVNTHQRFVKHFLPGDAI